MFDGEHGIDLHTMQGNWASSPGNGEVSYMFSSCHRNLGYILKLRRGWPFKTRVCSATSGLLSSYEENLRNLHEAWQGDTDASRGEAGGRGSLSSFHSDIRIPINFQESGTIIFCSFELRVPLEVSKGYETSCPDEAGTMAASRVSTGDSDIPSSCKMRDGPAFKPLQGHPVFFSVRASRCPFHFRQQYHGPFHIPIAEGSHLLRCLWKVGLPLKLNPGIQLHLEMIWGAQSFPRVAVLKFVFL